MSDSPQEGKKKGADEMALWEDLEFSREFDRQLGEVLEEYVDAAHKNTRVLADLSREIRDGLSAVIGYSEMLMEDAEGTKASEVGRIRESAWSLLGSVRQLESVVSEERYQRRVADILRAIAMVGTEGTDSSQVAQAILEKIVQLIDCEVAYLWLADGGSGKVIACWGDINENGSKVSHRPHFQELVRGEEQNGEPFVVTEGNHLLCVPLMALDAPSPIGMVTMRRPAERSFSKGVIELASRVGRHVSTTIGQSVRLETMQLHASTDDLTGVLNRRYFFKRASSLLSRAKRRRKPLTLLVLDLDHFKAVNDLHGHLDGDAVLRRVAQTLDENLRGDDILGRYGGEEFIIVLPDTPLRPHGENAAERLRQAIEDLRFVSNAGVKYNCTASIGVAAMSEEDTNLTAIFRRADQALYEAKARGRNRIALRSEGGGTGVVEEGVLLSGD